MMLSNFNFANPVWLWGLMLIPVGLLWYRYAARQHKSDDLNSMVDPKLLPHILINAGTRRTANIAWVYVILVTCIIMALANPRWSYIEREAYQPTASMVVLFDLSDSDSVTAARQQIEDLINNSDGLKVGLIAYAGIAHLITPITDDLHTVKNFLPALDTDLVTRHGDNLIAALLMANELLANEPGHNKSVLLVSSGAFAKQNLQQPLTKLRNNNVEFYVLGVGDANKTILQDIAKQGHGYYMTGDHSERAVHTILSKIQHDNATEEIVAGKIKQWEDSYYWFLIPAVLLLLYIFRHGALLLVIACLMIPEADARELFKNNNQMATQAYKHADFAMAAEMFTGDYNKGVALYRAGKYMEAENLFKQGESIASRYNGGNSQMHQQKWRDAIRSYESVLADDPQHVDAAFNLEIAKKMLDDEDADQVNQENMQQQEETKDRQQQDKQTDSDIKEEEDMQQQQQDQQQEQEAESSQQEEEEIDADNQNIEQDASSQDSNSDEGSDLWLNRIDSDIKVLLRNKFYIEGMLHEK